MDEKVILSKKNLFFILPSLIVLFSILLSAFLSKLLNKKINNTTLESVAAFICCLLVIIGAYSIYFEKQKKKALTKEKALKNGEEEGKDRNESDQEKSIDTKSTVKNRFAVLEGKDIYVDYVGTVICCTMQIITVALAAFSGLFKDHPYLATAHKVTDILGVLCFPLAIGLVLLSIICKNKQQEIKEEEKNNKEHKKKILIGAVMLVGMTLSLVGKLIGLFPTPLNISLGNTKSFSISLLTRVIGMGLFICALAHASINRPKQHLDEIKKPEISQNIPKTDTFTKN